MPEQNATPLKGADIIIQSILNEGADTIFAYPGGASMELHQAMSRKKGELRVVLPRHEQGGAFAAAGYARATGKTGVVMATSGPGATNLVTALADAHLDSIPLVAITGQVPSHLIGRNAFQETDMFGMTIPVVKHSYLVLDVNDIPRIFAEAFYLANSGRPGVVFIDIPKDIQQQLTIPDYNVEVNIPGYLPTRQASDEDVQIVREAISECHKPCLYVGGGIISSGAAAELQKFAESYNIPVVTTLMGIGAIPEDHPLSLKWLGMHGTYYGNYAANESDLLICIGARFDDRVTGNVENFARKSRIIHIDIDPSEHNKNKKADIAVCSDAKFLLTKLNENPLRKDYTAWHELITGWKRDYPLSFNDSDGEIKPQYAIRKLHEMTNGNAIVVPGVGQHQMWAGLFYDYSYPRQFLTSAGLGTMGFGLPTAIGAKIGCPEKTVINIDGDGSFQMNIQELGMAYMEDVAVKMVILNNQHLGMVAQWEDRFYKKNRGNTVLSTDKVDRPYPDFVTIANGYQIPGREVYTRDELEDAIREMLETDGPFLLDVHTKYEEHVLPMIPAGGCHKDIIME